jgi:hypothetical protein
VTGTQAAGLLVAYTLAVCVVFDLVFGRHDRHARRAAEQRVHQLQAELERRDRARTLRAVAPLTGPVLTSGHESGTDLAQVVALPASRRGPRRRSRTSHPSTFQEHA